MKSNSVRLAAVYSIVFLLLVFAPRAFATDDIHKAKKLMEAGLYSQALNLLEQYTHMQPNDAEAYYQQGACYLEMGKLPDAGRQFSRAVAKDAKYSPIVGDRYFMAGRNALARGDAEATRKLFEAAILHRPELKAEAARLCFDKGAAELDRTYIDMAMVFDEACAIGVYNRLMDELDGKSDERRLELYRLMLPKTI